MSEQAHNGERVLVPLPPKVEARLNRTLYCHHCHEVSETIVRGRSVWNRVIFACSCGGEIELDIRRG